MRDFAYYNGKYGLKEEISIPLSDRAIYFGDGVYDAAIGKNGKIFLSNEHILRFLGNAKKLEIAHNYTYDNILSILEKCAEMSGYESYFLYFQLSRGAKRRSHSYIGATQTNLLVTAEEFRLPDIKKPLSLITAEDLRYYYCNIKTINLLPAVIASGAAEKSGADEAVFCRGNTVTECAHSNISILKDRILYTHPKSNLILPGITRAHLLSTCKKLGIKYLETPFTTKELFSADEVLITSTSKLCRIADRIDNVRVGGKDSDTAEKICRYMINEFVNFQQENP